jgi:hypothetical protein
MNSDQASWEVAIATATQGMSEGGRRDRRRDGRRFAAWCTDHGLSPMSVDGEIVRQYITDLRGADPQQHVKVLSSIRTIMRVLDPEQAARATGLGSQAHQLARIAGSPLSALVYLVAAQFPARISVRRSAVGRLLAWCADVGVEPTAVQLVDLHQFRAWLIEMGLGRPGEVMVVAKDFIQLRHSDEGRRILGEAAPTQAPLKLELHDPLQPRFDIGRISSSDPLGQLPPRVEFLPAAGRRASGRWSSSA